MKESVSLLTARSQLTRLGALHDVVYGVGLVLIMQWLPLPSESTGTGEVWILDLFVQRPENLVGALIGLMFVITYWKRGNLLLSALDRTDSTHTTLSIMSLFFLLLLLYTVRVGPEIAEGSSRMGQSVGVALVGIAAGAAWWRARRAGLVREGATPQEQLNVQVEAFAEPLAALVTMPFAFGSELLWNVAWLSYLPIVVILKRRGRRADPGA